ncbi:MAG: ABC transporter ATP-binding protein [Thermoanaerobaculia bacterium]
MNDRRAVLEIHDLVVGYGEVNAVRGVDFTLENGEIAALLGPSGCGKTTLLRTIAGFERPCSGAIHLSGETVSDAETWVAPERRNVGMVFQDGALFPHLSVFDNVHYGVRGRRQARERVSEVLLQVGLARLDERFPDQLSGGQQQRVALARALAPRPRIILLDEPFANLDASLRAHVRQEMRSILEGAGITAILVTHDQEEALSFADRVALMLGGRIRQVGSPEEVYHRPASPEVARFLGNGHLVPCRVSSGRFESSLGKATCRAKDGPGQVFLRPEDLMLERWSRGVGASGTVISRRFFGHDVLDTVELASGETVEVRSLSSMVVPVGSPVRLSLRERAYQVFPERTED